MLNDMISPEVYTGQVIKLPIAKDASKKRVVKGSSAAQNVNKNTNNKQYALGEQGVGVTAGGND